MKNANLITILFVLVQSLIFEFILYVGKLKAPTKTFVDKTREINVKRNEKKVKFLINSTLLHLCRTENSGNINFVIII